MKRPLLPVALLYVGGILAAELVSLPPAPLLLTSLFVAGLALRWDQVRPLLLYALVVLAGLTNATLHTAVISPIDLRNILGQEPRLVTIRGKLTETPTLRVYQHDQQPAWRTLARLEASSVCLAKGQWEPTWGRVAVATPGLLTNYFSGQSVEVTGVADRPKPAVAEGTFDYRRYLQQQGIYYQLKAESDQDWRVIDSPGTVPLADRFSAWARRALALGLPTEDASLRLEWALALGWKTALTEEASEPFVRAATYHIFAVDGLRMAILFGIFYSVLRALSIPRPICGVVLLPVIWFYVALTGWPASAIRATVMLTIIILGWVLKRPADPTNSLFAAALIILVWQPQQLFQAGFQLSFLVVLCLILTIPPLLKIMERRIDPEPFLPRKLQRKWHPLVRVPVRFTEDLVVTSFAAWIGSLPLVAYYFNIVTPISTPANVIAVPLCVLVLISNLLSLSFAAWLPGVAELFNHAGWFVMECIRLSSEWFTHWPFAYFYTPAPSLFTSCLYYALLFALVTGWLFKPALRLWKLSGLTAATLLWTGCYVRELATTKLTILPVNGGTSIYYDSFGFRNDLLVDAGPSNAVQFITKPFLRGQGVNQLPKLLLTHGDIHHTGGTEPLLQLFDVPCVYTNPVRFRSAVYRKILDRLGKQRCLLQPLSRNALVGHWTVLHPDAGDKFSKADDGAVVLRASFSGTRVLLLSDLGKAGQSALLERADNLQADIVVAGLPSTGEPLSVALFEAIHPRLVIISDSEFPVSERASPRLRGRLRRKQIPVIYTREAGAVTLRFRKDGWELRTMNNDTLKGTPLNDTAGNATRILNPDSG